LSHPWGIRQLIINLTTFVLELVSILVGCVYLTSNFFTFTSLSQNECDERLLKQPLPTIFPYNIYVPELLLQTKLYMPPLRPNLVPRPQLIERLNEGLLRKLTLISAPAGGWTRDASGSSSDSKSAPTTPAVQLVAYSEAVSSAAVSA
jgi:hypothetical protein